MYDKLSEKLLFHYYMVHSTRKEDVYCTVPFYLSSQEYGEFKESSEVLNQIVFRIMCNINTEFQDFKEYIPDFKYKDKILSLKRPMDKVIWVRYDGFLRSQGGVFYSEFNYDKPCAEREILATGDMEAYKNINSQFRKELKASLEDVLVKDDNKKHYNIALLSDPCHYEETHLMYLLRSELHCDKVDFINAGPKNLYVKYGLVYAFEKPLDIIIRLFPTEYSYEINDFEKILEVFEKGRVNILNDPRVIIGQCKTLYSYLWKLVEHNDIRISSKEAEVITKTLPHTELFNRTKLQYILQNKDKLVLKPVYGRYSIDVFIGALLSDQEWLDCTAYVSESDKVFIIQEFCEIKPSDTYYTLDGKFVFPTKAFANVGCFMLSHRFSGSCVRWSEDYLTSDDYTWITPIGIKSDVIKVKEISLEGAQRKTLWNKITERAMFEADFTGKFAKNFQYVGIDYLTIGREKHKELEKATEALAALMYKTQELVYSNLEVFSEILGISSLQELIKHRFTEEFLFLGRMDWAIDSAGNLKLLEINSETPAGLCESLFIDNIIKEELNVKLESVNKEFSSKLLNQFIKILKDFEKSRDIRTIGILASTYYEDWYTANSLLAVVKELPYEFVVGSIYDTKISEGGKLSLFGKELDAVYRYYPLDWFDEEDMGDKKEALKNTLSINPTHTIISQSKAFFSVIYELLKQGYYNESEAELIIKYIPKTTFEVEELETCDYIVKPILSREGHGVSLACQLEEQPDENNIYQERVQTLSLDYWVQDNLRNTKDSLYPIIGTYVTGTEFAGIYTRLGKFVTDNICVYVPMFIS